MSKNRVMGRLVSAREEPKSTLVTLSTRPQRVAFIIGQDFAAEELLRLIRYNTTIWGGIFNAFVPTDGTELVDGWWESLKTHDPDVVVWCGSVFPQFAQELEARLQPFRCISWQGLFVEDAPRIDHLNNVEMRSVLASVYDELQGKSAANVRIPVFDSDQPFSLFAAAQLGMLDEDYHRVYVKSLRASEVDFREGQVQNFL